jgi:coatomer protein complex subunit alpha (xenin)
MIYEFHKDLKTVKQVSERRQDFTTAAVFISKDKLAILDNNKELSVCNFDGTGAKKVQINRGKSASASQKIDNIFPAPLGKVLLSTEDTLIMYDLAARKIVAEMQGVPDVKQIYWSGNFSHVVITTKTSIIMATKTLEIINKQKETQKIKSGCFDEAKAFIYSTSTHIKYLFCEGKTSGTFKSLEEPIYTAFYMKNQVFSFTKSGDMISQEVNNTDYQFKFALQ